MTSPPEPAAGQSAAAAAEFDDADFRTAMGQFPTGVTVIAALDDAADPVPDGGPKVHGMTANAFMSVSMDPALIVVSVGGATRTHAVLERSTSFGVSVLRQGQERIALQLAGRPSLGGPVDFDHLDVGPVLHDCLLSVCANITTAVRAGDHTLFVGAITRINRGPTGARPLGYHRGRFVSVGPPTGDWPVDLIDAWAGSLRSGWG